MNANTMSQIDWRAVTELIRYEPSTHFTDNEKGKGISKLRQNVFHFWIDFFAGTDLPDWKKACKMSQYWHTDPTFLIQNEIRLFGGIPVNIDIQKKSFTFRRYIIMKKYKEAKELFYEIMKQADESIRERKG